MQLENSFVVPAGPEEAWKTLLDVERVAPCMPGATLTSHDGDSFAGTVKVKVGPIAMTYKGTAAFVDKDEAARKVVIDAKGRETRGSGTANAKITCTLTPDGDGTRVDVLTDLAITGKPAQFGRGVIGEVAGKVITQFADALAEEIRSGTPTADAPADDAAGSHPDVITSLADETPSAAPADPTSTSDSASASGAAATTGSAPTPPPAPAPKPAPAATTATTPTPTPAQPRRSAEAIDLLDVAGAPLAKRFVPVGIAAAVGLLVGLLLGGRRK